MKTAKRIGCIVLAIYPSCAIITSVTHIVASPTNLVWRRRTMNVIKRSGEEVTFDAIKIENAVHKANEATNPKKRMEDTAIKRITDAVIDSCNKINRSIGVEEIQDLVENEIMREGYFAVARNYITYRYERALVRKANSTDDQILSLIGRNNEEAKQERRSKAVKLQHESYVKIQTARLYGW